MRIKALRYNKMMRFLQFSLFRLVSLGGPLSCVNTEKKIDANVKKIIYKYLTQLVSPFSLIRWDFTVTLPPFSRHETILDIQENEFFKGFSKLKRELYIFDYEKTSDHHTLWNELSSRARNTIRKAQKNKIVTEIIADSRYLEQYYRLHLKTCKRSGATPRPKKYFSLIMKNIFASNAAFMVIASLEGKVIAGAIFSLRNKSMWYWLGASNKDGLLKGANTLIQWEALKYGLCNEVKYYEVGEFPNQNDSDKLKSLAKFKQQFSNTSMGSASFISKSEGWLYKRIKTIRNIYKNLIAKEALRKKMEL